MLPDDLRHPILVEPEIPGPRWVNDDVRTMLAQTQTVYAIDPDVAVQAGVPQLALERPARLFCAALLAISTLAYQHVRLVVTYLYLGQRPNRGFGLLLFLFGDKSLRLLITILNNQNIPLGLRGRYDVS